MKILSLTIIFLLLSVPFDTEAKKKKESPRAEIKVGYNYHKLYVNESEGIVGKDIPFILLANLEKSKFFNAHTEYLDSLNSTSSGRKLSTKLFDEAFKKYWETKDRSYMSNVVYETQLYVFISKPDNEIQVYDYIGTLDYGRYNEPIEAMNWEICDSTKVIFGYECTMAKVDYHGREWTAWFTPDIPIQAGPWKLTGLPGLILEASESSGQHWFSATGIEKSDKEIIPIYKGHDYEKMTRKEMLKSQRYGKDHSSSLASALLGLNLGSDHINTEEEAKIDFLETDYRK